MNLKQFLFFFFFGISISAFSQNINTPENFPDPVFRMVVEEFMGVSPGGKFTALEAAVKTGELRYHGYHKNNKIKDVTGLKFFPNISNLILSENELTSLDVSNNTDLKFLYCGRNQLLDLDVSKNPVLLDIDCLGNQLSYLDVSNCTALNYLVCSDNQLTSLDVSHNTALDRLDCSGNQLTSLDVSNNTALTYIWCNSNQLTSLDVSSNTSLKYLDCSNNKLTSLSSLIVNESLGLYFVDVRFNYIGCDNFEEAVGNIILLTERIGNPKFQEEISLLSGFAFSPQKDCETPISDWYLY